MYSRAYFFVGIAVAAGSLCACDPANIALSPVVATSTVTATVTAIAGSPATTPAGGSLTEWTGAQSGTGMFAVGNQPRDGLVGIPEGRYAVKVAPGKETGDWMLCDSALCGPAFHANATVVGHVTAPYSSIIYIGPKARTLWIDNVILFSGDPKTIPDNRP